jgi:hypothetical protein
MATKGSWAQQPHVQRDRDRVIQLVKQEGRARLRFSTRDVRARMQSTPHIRLHEPGNLWRHMQALPAALIRAVERRLDGAARTERYYVLTERLHEYEGRHRVLDDLEKAHFALWVAVTVAGQDRVPTSAVTRVMQTIEALAPDKEAQTSLRLTALASRCAPLARKHRVDGERWVRWKPVGDGPPAHDDFDHWVDEFRAKTAGKPRYVAGPATLGGAAVELIQIAIDLSRTRNQPMGAPPTVKELRAAAGRDPRAREIFDRIERASSLGRVLGDITKARVVGRARVATLATKTTCQVTGRVYYDVPDLPGSEVRSLYIRAVALRKQTSSEEMRALDRERSAAQGRINAFTTPRGRELAVARLKVVDRYLNRLRVEIEEVWEEARWLRAPLEEVLSRCSGAVHVIAKKMEAGGGVCLEVERLPYDSDRVPDDLVGRYEAMPLTASEYVSWTPERDLRGRTPAQVLALATPLERYPNPRFTDRRAEDPIAAASHGVDRVDGLIYLAERGNSRLLPWFQAGRALLGSQLRDPRPVRPLLSNHDEDDTRAALAALVLLGDGEAGRWAERTLADERATAPDLVVAFRILLVEKSLPQAWPAHVRSHPSPVVRRALKTVLLAAAHGRWLMQR